MTTHTSQAGGDRLYGLALSGGGTNAHSFLTGLFAGLYDSAKKQGASDPLSKVFENTDVVSTNSGSSWFGVEAGWSENFINDNIASGKYKKLAQLQDLIPKEKFQNFGQIVKGTKLEKGLGRIGKAATLIASEISLGNLENIQYYLSVVREYLEKQNPLNNSITDITHGDDYGIWNGFVHNKLINNPQLEGKTLSSPSLNWLKNSKFIMASGVQSDTGIASTMNSRLGFTTNYWSSKLNLFGNDYDVLPIAISSRPGTTDSREGNVELTSTNHGFGSSIWDVGTFAKNTTTSFPNAPSTPAKPGGNAWNFNLVSGSSMSSAGAAAVPRMNQMVSATQELGHWDWLTKTFLSNELRELSPLIQFNYRKNYEVKPSEDVDYIKTGLLRSVTGVSYDVGDTRESIARDQAFRTVDGGYFDNSTVAMNLRELQKKDKTKDFSIVAFLSDHTPETTIPGDLRVLFKEPSTTPINDVSLKDLMVFEEDSQKSINIPSAGVFKLSDGPSLDDTVNKNIQTLKENTDDGIFIKQIKLNVETVKNDDFEISEGQKGDLIVYFAQSSKNDMLPNSMDGREFTLMQNNYDMAKDVFDDASAAYLDFIASLSPDTV